MTHQRHRARWDDLFKDLVEVPAELVDGGVLWRTPVRLAVATLVEEDQPCFAGESDSLEMPTAPVKGQTMAEHHGQCGVPGPGDLAVEYGAIIGDDGE